MFFKPLGILILVPHHLCHRHEWRLILSSLSTEKCTKIAFTKRPRNHLQHPSIMTSDFAKSSENASVNSVLTYHFAYLMVTITLKQMKKLSNIVQYTLSLWTVKIDMASTHRFLWCMERFLSMQTMLDVQIWPNWLSASPPHATLQQDTVARRYVGAQKPR